MNFMRSILSVLLLSAAYLLASALGAVAEDVSVSDPLGWPQVTKECRPWAYWWWLGSAVNPTDLTRELERYQAAGLGGMHIIPIYGAKGAESQFLSYLSPAWMSALKHVGTETQRLGMGVDMTTGTGWCFGGPTVSERDANCKVSAKQYTVAAGESLKEKVDRKSLQTLVAVGEEGGKCVELKEKLGEDGVLNWKAGSGNWRLFALYTKPTMKVKRPAPGGEGYMINTFSAEATRNYLTRFSEAFAHYDGPKPRAMYHDSYEYNCDWSPDLLTQFEKRRGYRLQSEFPALFGTEHNDHVARVKADYRETISEMMLENFAKVWVKWSHDHGFLTRNQAHGSPGNLLDLYAAADMPETEMFHKDRERLVSKFASSAAHVAGHPLISSETGTWLSEHFTETLEELKLLVDDMFVSGINHVFYHGCCYSPDEAGWPGWLFYASTEMNPRNSIWHDAPALNGYIARCQSVLQSGRPDNDLLLYWPIHDYWHNSTGMVQNMTVHGRAWLEGQPVGKVARQLWDRGFTFDYVSNRQLSGAKSKAGAVKMPGGNYRVVVVPECAHLPVETLEDLLSLAHGGATIIFQSQLPQDVPGAGILEQRRSALKKLLATVQLIDSADSKVKQAKLGAGRVLVGELEPALALAGLKREPMADHADLMFIRRATDTGRHYFITNHGKEPIDEWVSLGTPAASVVILDPMNGRSGMGAVRHGIDGSTQLYLQLQAGQSLILRTSTRSKIEGASWPYLKIEGQPTEVTGNWQVKFIQGGPELPEPVQTPKLVSWTEFAGEKAQRFAGSAVYSISFDAPALTAGQSMSGRCLIDLGRVSQSARIRINGKELGTLFAAPFRLLVENLKPTGNLLEVEVTNVSANRIRDLDIRRVKWRNFYEINFVDINYKPFDASKWPLTESGLIGPVKISRLGEWKASE